MIPAKIHLEVVTPERRVLVQDVDEVILPGSTGSFGVLPGHAPLLASLTAGVAKVRSGAHSETLALSDGFAEVGPDRVTVLAETCEKAGEIDPARARTRIAELRSILVGNPPETEVEVVRLRIMKHVARLNAVDGTIS